MLKKLRGAAWIVVPALLYGGIHMLGDWWSRAPVFADSSTLERSAAHLTTEMGAVQEALPEGELPEGMSEEALAALLDNPRVQTYFDREREKQALADYFSGGNSGLSDEQVWQLIEGIEGEGRILAYEALALKLEWLERNSDSQAEFEQASQALVEEYRSRSLQSAQAYDPYEQVPGFAAYKAEEQRIVAEVQKMDAFPQGTTRQEYLRQRLREARERLLQ
ncbi:hypothetical protein [Microbulbifer hainanensis]|uniref:hypothetical protein n=1 Tax=Microbulbifer hainanensis TaxID=2735675 RepID=UPI0018666615|nr:hypothetical protein [Microbulbifer hainanensis]